MKGNKCGLYKITNIVNNKIIIGQSTKLNDRWSQHKSILRKNEHHNPHLQSAWNKYGEKSFKFEIIFVCAPQDLDAAEIKFIKEYDSTDKKIGYNIQKGGEKVVHSEESRRKISEAKKGSKHSEETKIKMSEAKKGERHPNFGKHLSNDTKIKIGKSHAGKPLSKEHKLKIAKRNLGNSYHLGKPHSLEAKQKISLSNKKHWLGEKVISP